MSAVVSRGRDLAAIALQSLRARLWRSVGLALPVAVGVAAVIASFASAASARAGLEESLIRLGADQVVVSANQQSARAGESKLPEEAADRVQRLLPAAHAVGALAEQPDRKIRPSVAADPLAAESVTSRVIATRPGLPDALRIGMHAGRFLEQTDETNALDVAVLGYETARAFGIDAPGQTTIFIDDRPFAVVGILERATSYPQVNRAALVPFSTAVSRWGDDGSPRDLIVRTSPSEAQPAARILPTLVTFGDGPPPTASTAADLLSAREEIDDSLRLLVAASGGLALLLGACGIAFALWAAVLARTSEIGIRRALGATRRDITVQFLLETSLIGVLAAVIGAAAGPLVTAVLARQNAWPVVIDWTLVGLTALLAIELAVLAGLIPARRAASLEPLDALRT